MGTAPDGDQQGTAAESRAIVPAPVCSCSSVCVCVSSTSAFALRLFEVIVSVSCGIPRGRSVSHAWHRAGAQ